MEHDADEQENVRRIADDTYVADGTARLDEINDSKRDSIWNLMIMIQLPDI